ncbi:MAG TPA: peptidase [Bacteroidetes bacterium]|nr:peptidase [Bacteroidota bacterium]
MDEATNQDLNKPTFKKWSIGWINQKLYHRRRGLLITVLSFLLVVLLFAERVVIFVNAGESAVLFKRFQDGTQLNKVYGEGFHLIFPWNIMTVYNVRIQHELKQFEVLSANGLKIKVDASIRYRPIKENLPDLHQQVGPDYADRIVYPEVEAVVRQIFGQYLPEDIYSSQKFIIQNTVQNAIFEVSERFVDLDELLITRITLPDMIVDAIEEKLEKEQVALGYQFRLDSERLEAERKRIEAGGIRDFQSIVSSGLTENYLRFKGIEATLKLSESPNAKIVVIGGGKDGLPIILDGTTNTPDIVN